MRAGMQRVRALAAAGGRRSRHGVAAVIGLAILVVVALATTVVAKATAGTSRHASAAAVRTLSGLTPSGEVGSGPVGSSMSSPASTSSASSTGTAAPARHMQAPAVSHRPHVPRRHHLIPATLLARQDYRLRPAQLKAIKQIPGVTRILTVGAGTATVDGHRARVLAVNPTHFRPWTPRLTAASNPLWSSIASGELTASFDMGHFAKLPLGGTVPVRARHRQPVRIGAFATVAMGGTDAVVDAARGRSLGLPRGNGILIAAPHADPLALRAAVARVLGKGAATNLLREVVVVRDAGEFMTRVQISTVLHAAASRLGMPYVWGATGPRSFDCSGLVMWSFAKAGIIMPRVSEEQFFAGPHVPYRDARPGDLLFWHYDPTDPTDVDHVAIYVGHGEMIEAPHTGDHVKVIAVPLDHLAGVVRVDPAISRQIG